MASDDTTQPQTVMENTPIQPAEKKLVDLKRAREIAAEKKKAISDLRRKEKEIKYLEVASRMKELENREAVLKTPFKTVKIEEPAQPATPHGRRTQSEKTKRSYHKRAKQPPLPPVETELEPETEPSSSEEESQEEEYVPPPPTTPNGRRTQSEKLKKKSVKSLTNTTAKEELKRRIEQERLRIAYASLFPYSRY